MLQKRHGEPEELSVQLFAIEISSTYQCVRPTATHNQSSIAVMPLGQAVALSQYPSSDSALNDHMIVVSLDFSKTCNYAESALTKFGYDTF